MMIMKDCADYYEHNTVMIMNVYVDDYECIYMIMNVLQLHVHDYGCIIMFMIMNVYVHGYECISA